MIRCNDIIITISDKTQGWNERNIIHFIMYSHYLLFPPLSYFCIQYCACVCVSKVYLHIFRFCCVFVYILTLPLDGKGLLFEHRSIETKI